MIENLLPSHHPNTVPEKFFSGTTLSPTVVNFNYMPIAARRFIPRHVLIEDLKKSLRDAEGGRDHDWQQRHSATPPSPDLIRSRENADHSPRNRGCLFSINADTPSRKSRVRPANSCM